jgi:hypothetical protein
VQQYATGTGTGPLTLGLVTSDEFVTLQTAGLAEGDTTYVRIQHRTIKGEWECCRITRVGNTVTRLFDTKSFSPNGVSLMNFSAGDKIISASILAGQAVTEDAAGNVGIGVAPTHKLNVAGTVGIGDTGSRLQVSSTGSGAVFNQNDNSNITFQHLGVDHFRISPTGPILPAVDNSYSNGIPGNRWSVIYAGTGTINTSGRSDKQQISKLTETEREWARLIKERGPRRYKLNDAVAVKGAAARWHFGFIVEDILADAAKAGIEDPWAYGFLCADEIEETGTVRYGLRYDELQVFLLAV